MDRVAPRRLTAVYETTGLRLTLTVEADAAPASRPVVDVPGEPLPDEPPASRPGLARADRRLSLVPSARRTA